MIKSFAGRGGERFCNPGKIDSSQHRQAGAAANRFPLSQAWSPSRIKIFFMKNGGQLKHGALGSV
jgi:hypothetical protein